MNRRQFLRVCGQLTVGCAGAALTGYGYDKHVNGIEVVFEQVQIPIPNLEPALERFKIVQISDIHIEPYPQTELIREAISLANNSEPDLIVLTGDFVTRDAEAIAVLSPFLSNLNAGCGVFACLGNHEIWTNPQVVRTGLEEADINVLVNQGVTLTVDSAQLYLAGVDDCWSGQPDLNAALAEWSGGIPAILLAHEPDFADTFCLDGRVSLQLSGHSHGGQVRLPGLGATVLPQHGKKYDYGLYNVNGMWLYTNRGLGAMPIPYRFNCSPEVTEITLISQS